MATVQELRERTEVEDKPFVIMLMSTFETCYMQCVECAYVSSVVYEYDEDGLEQIHLWAQDHTCVVV